MDTKLIILEEVTLAEYERMEAFWSVGRRKRDCDGYFRLSNPVTWDNEDYEGLLFYLLEHKCSSLLSVNNHGSWVRIEKTETKKPSASKVAEMAEIACKDALKNNFLEISLKSVNGGGPAIIGFVEFDKQIIGYQTSIPGSMCGFFDFRPNGRKYAFNQGLWVPESYFKASS